MHYIQTPRVGVHLEDCHPDMKGVRQLLRNGYIRSPVEDGDGDTKPPPNGGNPVPLHPPQIKIGQKHWDRLP